MKKTKITLIIVFAIAILFLIYHFMNTTDEVYGVKLSITLNIENLNTSNYVVDLLVYDENGTNYRGEIDYNGNGEQYKATGYKDDSISESFIAELQKLHNINYDGWISESTRWDKYLLFADCRGNAEHTHRFSYFGTPEKYKVVIMNNETDEIKVTDVIERKDAESNITVDYNTMEVHQERNFNLKNVLLILSITIIIVVIVINLLIKLRKNK